MEAAQATNFDINPPMPLVEYEHTVRSVNFGYEFTLTLAHAFLRALRKPDLDLLVVGAGGGAEIEQFLPDNSGWRMTGVDPSQKMLDLATAKAERLGVQSRVTLVPGTVESLPHDQRFDAATCLFVLHFLPDEAKVALLRGMAQRLQPGAPVVVVSGGCSVDLQDHGALRDDLLGAWQQYGELHGMPPARMAGIIAELLGRQNQATPEAEYRALMHTAGFTHVTNVLSIMGGALCAWIAR